MTMVMVYTEIFCGLFEGPAVITPVDSNNIYHSQFEGTQLEGSVCTLTLLNITP